MDKIPYERDAWYIFDRGYVDFGRLHKIATIPANFVVRAKSNLAFRRIYSRKADKSMDLRYDQIGVLTGFYVSKNYPDKLRKVVFYDAEQDRKFVFLTNNLDMPTVQIAMLYKQRCVT